MNTPRQPIRSYVLRAGRITAAQRRALEELLPRHGIPFVPGPLDLDRAFGRTAPRVLEIGFGNGDTLVELAAARPDADFIGVEVHPPGVGHCLLEIESRGVGNVRVIVHDAVEVLAQQVLPASLDEVLLYFPDPWPKKRHHKRRIVQPGFAALVADRLKPGGVFKLATDWEPYAAWMLEVLGASGDLENAAPGGGCIERPGRSATRFERRGRRLGHAVFDLEFRRRPA
ncbi:MAG TPA: tRNA (guanosine(46)-N7)-methyltransferase TrmB [Steroidobacteraceae bacterium]|nr:tRNA (guanosine(46)-N7)-methyltransferase TrmB [Steroidobacteraceae bacterium]